jgi:hypothetical protein
VKEVNLTLFYRRFPILSALSQLYELKEAQMDGTLFRRGLIEDIRKEEGENNEDPYAHEKAMVRNTECDEDSPLCLYDFTLKAIMLDHLPLSVSKFDMDSVIVDYFYPSDEESKEAAVTKHQLDFSQRSKIKVGVETPNGEGEPPTVLDVVPE